MGEMDVSHDGKYLAFPWEQYSPAPTLWLGVVSSSSGALVRSMKAPPGVYRMERLHWSENDSGLQYLLTRVGVTNLWEQPLSGTRPKQLTEFTSDRIFSFNWSLDHKRLLLARGNVTSDVVLFSNLK